MVECGVEVTCVPASGDGCGAWDQPTTAIHQSGGVVGGMLGGGVLGGGLSVWVVECGDCVVTCAGGDGGAWELCHLLSFITPSPLFRVGPGR